jgi:hypothetical protein
MTSSSAQRLSELETFTIYKYDRDTNKLYTTLTTRQSVVVLTTNRIRATFTSEYVHHNTYLQEDKI